MDFFFLYFPSASATPPWVCPRNISECVCSGPKQQVPAWYLWMALSWIAVTHSDIWPLDGAAMKNVREQNCSQTRSLNKMWGWDHITHSSQEFMSSIRVIRELGVRERRSCCFRQLVFGNVKGKMMLSFYSVSVTGDWRWKYMSLEHLNEHKCLQKCGGTEFSCPCQQQSLKTSLFLPD